MSRYVQHPGCCNPTLVADPGECPKCIDTPGVIVDMPCPWCRPDEYPDGFPGLTVDGIDHWLIPPMTLVGGEWRPS